MTGGTKQWNPFEYDKEAVENNVIGKDAYVTPDSEHTQIYRIDDDKMSLVYTYDENLDMGDVCTLEKFLELALYYAPAEHLMVSAWDHGGGPLNGAEVDENTGNIISVPEYTAFAEALFKARGNKTDILGFDACLMGGIEVAYELAGKCDRLGFSQAEVLAEGFNYKTLGEITVDIHRVLLGLLLLELVLVHVPKPS